MTNGMTIATLALFATAALSAAQAPQAPSEQPPAPQAQPSTQEPPPASTPQSQATATTTAQTTATLVGCLYQEGQIPGRTPNVVERAGVLEDYILADAADACTNATRDTSRGSWHIGYGALDRQHVQGREYPRRTLEGTGGEASRGVGSN